MSAQLQEGSNGGLYLVWSELVFKAIMNEGYPTSRLGSGENVGNHREAVLAYTEMSEVWSCCHAYQNRVLVS